MGGGAFLKTKLQKGLRAELILKVFRDFLSPSDIQDPGTMKKMLKSG